MGKVQAPTVCRENASMDQAPRALQVTGILLEGLNHVCNPSQLCSSCYHDLYLLDNRDTLNTGWGWCVLSM